MPIDKFMLTKQEIEEFIANNRLHRFDTTVPKESLTSVLTEQGTLQFTGNVENHPNQPIKFSPSAFSQMLNKLRIPSEFFARCPTNLEQQIFNHFAGQHEDSLFYRMAPTAAKETIYETGSDLACRAVLTDKYGIIDDHQLFPIAFTALEESAGQVAYRRLRCDDRITQLYVDFPDAHVTDNENPYHAGLMITNSETGHSSVWIEPVVSTNTLSFQNRATLQKQGVKCRFVHRGVPKLQEVKEMITRAKDIAQVGIVQLLEAQQQIINKDYALAFTKNIEALPKRIYDILEEEWEEVAELNRLQVASRILVLAQELPLFQRITVEQAACGITKVFDNFQSRMMEIAQAMANQEE